MEPPNAKLVQNVLWLPVMSPWGGDIGWTRTHVRFRHKPCDQCPAYWGSAS